MSRSYKKSPVAIAGEDMSQKKTANKRVRKLPLSTTLKGKQYKKVFNSWDIKDWVFYEKEPLSEMDWDTKKHYKMK